jgi:two-component system chemotaxis response regulator CheY
VGQGVSLLFRFTEFVESEAGRVEKFSTMIPVLPERYASVSSNDPAIAPRPRMSKKRVLITDEHPSIRFLLRSLVETEQFTVCGEAANGAEAIEKAKELAPDLILLDFSMPGMNGGETAKVLKKSMPQVRIILFTLHEESVNQALAAAMGVDMVVAKPGAAFELLDCMRSVLGLGEEPSTAGGPASGSD